MNVLVLIVPLLATRVFQVLTDFLREIGTTKLLLSLPIGEDERACYRIDIPTVVFVYEEMASLKMLKPESPIFQLAIHGTRASPSSIL